ncbi:MAG: hypothetical protein A2539_08420 [Elusimicrobia bacterium RIFOXYD2_FULL_34_15]|nr:MAG: hypothetical protein A2539_08420 [Elusimicrobia bacterium RIFOXYD2_FULL_34_15]
MRGIFKKLFLTYVLVIVVSSAIIAIFTDYVLKEYYKDEIAHELEVSAVLVEDMMENFAFAKNPSKLQNFVKRLGEKIKTRITIVNSDGTVFADSESDPETMENHKDRPEMEKALSGIIGKSVRHSDTLNIDMMYVAIPLKSNGNLSGAIRLSIFLSDINRKIKQIHKIIIVSVLIGILAALLLSFIVGKSFVNPILLMKTAAEKISKGDFNQKLDFKANDELARLGHSLNAMSEELQKNITETEREKNELSIVLSDMVEGVILVDKNRRIIMLNQSLSNMLYLRSDEAVGRHSWEILGNEEINNAIESTLAKAEPVRKDITILLPEEKYIQVQTSVIYDENNELYGVVGVFHDITQIRKLENMRTEFVANVSHELKTPLTAISGFIETLKEGAINDKKEASKFLDIMQANTERLNNLINDMLVISKSESKEMKLELKKVNIEKILESISSMYKERIDKKSQKLIFEIANNFTEITADEEKLIQIFSNLIDNAIKFTGQGGVITVKCYDVQDKIKIEVSDTGIGIPKEHLPRIFERFYRVDKARSREMGGTGLGLAIVKHLIQLHGGTVSVESQPGRGSSFTVVLPKEINS